MSVHERQKRSQRCPYCEESFKTHNMLKRHIKTHSDGMYVHFLLFWIHMLKKSRNISFPAIISCTAIHLHWMVPLWSIHFYIDYTSKMTSWSWSYSSWIYLNPAHGEVYLKQHYVVGFLWVLRFPPPVNLTPHNITEILLSGI